MVHLSEEYKMDGGFFMQTIVFYANDCFLLQTIVWQNN